MDVTSIGPLISMWNFSHTAPAFLEVGRYGHRWSFPSRHPVQRGAMDLLGRLHIDCTELLFTTVNTTSRIWIMHCLRVRDFASLVLQSPTLRFWIRNWELPCGDTVLSRNRWNRFSQFPAAQYSTLSQGGKEMIGHISFDETSPSFFLHFSRNGRARLFAKISAAWSSVLTWWTLILSGNFLLIPKVSSVNVFVRVMNLIELARFTAFELSQKIGVCCTWRSLLTV